MTPICTIHLRELQKHPAIFGITVSSVSSNQFHASSAGSRVTGLENTSAERGAVLFVTRIGSKRKPPFGGGCITEEDVGSRVVAHGLPVIIYRLCVVHRCRPVNQCWERARDKFILFPYPTPHRFRDREDWIIRIIQRLNIFLIRCVPRQTTRVSE